MNYVHILFDSAQPFFLVHFIFTLVTTLSFFSLVHGALMMRCLHCAFSTFNIMLEMYHISPYTLCCCCFYCCCCTHTSFACRMIRTLYATIWSNRVSSTNVHTTHRQRFLLGFVSTTASWLNDFDGVCTVFIRCFAVERCVHILRSLACSLVRPFICIHFLLLSTCLSHRFYTVTVAAKSSSKSDSVVLSIGSVAFYFAPAALCIWFVK